MSNEPSNDVPQSNFDERGRFLPGNSVSKLGGRPKGSRNKLGEAFIEDLRDVWLERGKQALMECAATKPGEFCRIVAMLLPKEIDLLYRSDFDGLETTDQIVHKVAIELGEEAAEMVLGLLAAPAASAAPDLRRKRWLRPIEHDATAEQD